MKAQLRAAVLPLALMIVAAPAAAQRIRSDTALASMVAAERAFSKYSLERNTQDAFVRYMSQDGFLYRPKVVRAHAFLRARPMPPGLMLAWEPEYADVAGSGDLGYTTGEWISQRRDYPGAPPTFGQYATIWRRQADGSWKAEVNIGIAHDPDPVGVKSLSTAPAPEYRGSPRHAADSVSLFAADSALAVVAQEQNAATAFQRRTGPALRLLRMGRFPLRADTANAVLRATPTYRWKAVGGGISRAGDLGYTFGVYSIVPPLGGNTESGDFLRIWRRDREGVWRVVLDATSPI